MWQDREKDLFDFYSFGAVSGGLGYDEYNPYEKKKRSSSLRTRPDWMRKIYEKSDFIYSHEP